MDGDSPLQGQQRAFAAHIRNPAQSPPPAGIEDRRMRIYRELFFNNLNGFLRASLPVLHAVMAPDAWHSLVRDFFARHAAQSPFFRDIPREFLRYLEEQRGDSADDPPFLRELAHYEWVELALSVHEDPVPPPGLDPTGDLSIGRPLLSPLAWLLCYRFPVQRISPDYQPSTPQAEPTHLLAYRDAHDDVRFLVLNPVSARLFALLAEGRRGAEALDCISAELQHPRPEQVRAGGRQTMEDWRARGILLGTH